MRLLVPHRVHQPRGLEHEQPQLLKTDTGLGGPVAHHALLAQRLAERDTLRRAAAHQLDGHLRDADAAHAVMDAARPEAGLRDREPVALAADEVGRRHAHGIEDQLGVPAVVPVVVAEHPHAAHHRHAWRIARYEDHRLLPVPLRGRVGLAHDDEDRRVGVHRAADPPLAAVDHVLIAVAFDPGGDVGGIRRGDLRLRHGE
jgi:hypothetical protein